MKSILITFISLLLILPVYCQVNWFPVGAKWHYGYGSFSGGGITTLEVLSEDTMIGNNAYKRILSTTIFGWPPFILDTLSEMLYVFEENQVVYGYDRWLGGTFLYDFNAGIGDTLDMYFGGVSPSPFVVDSVGVIDINGSQLAFQDIRYPNLFEQGEYYEMRVIEGIGSINSHLFHSHTIPHPVDGPVFSFRCYEDENIGLVNLTNNQEDCDYIEGVTATLENTNVSISVFPNPAVDFVTVQYADQSIDNFIVIDILGSIRVKKHTTSQSFLSIDVSELESGLYFIIGVDKTGRTIFTEKIIKN